MADPPLVQVTTAVPDDDAAAAVAAALVDTRLAACVQVLGPMRSRYWWDGSVEEATEWLCVAKTTTAQADRAVAAIVEIHPYDEPEVLVTPVVGGAAGYLDWVGRTATFSP